MNFRFSEDQDAIADVMARVFQDLDATGLTRRWYEAQPLDRETYRSVAKTLAEQGLLGTFVEESRGGSGLSLLDVVQVVEAAGRHLFSYPLIETLASAWALERFGDDAARGRWLPDLAAGRSILTLAWAGLGDEPVVTRDGGGRLKAGPIAVPYAELAEKVLVPAALEGHDTGGLLVLDTNSVPRETVTAWDRAAPLATLSLDSLVVPDDRVVPVSDGGLDDLSALGRILAAADILGTLEAAMDRTVDYLKTRRQFGGPIGRFQALKHTAAQDHVRIANIRLAVRYAALSFTEGAPRRAFYAALAKAYASEHGVTAAEDFLHLHGGMGFTWDADLHLFLKRVWRLSAQCGGAEVCRREMAAGYFDAAGGTDD